MNPNINQSKTTPSLPTGPYCGQCQYPLDGLTESSKCPECGGPLVEVLRWPHRPGPTTGKRWQSRATVGGRPLIHIASGPGPDGRMGKARGFVAIGDEAMGFIAVGGVARGVVAIGGSAIGVFAFGGVSVGLVSGIGGAAVAGLIAVGGAAGAGGAAVGGAAFGLLAHASGLGQASIIGLPMPATLWQTAGVTALALVAALAYAAVIVASRLLSRSGESMGNDRSLGEP